MFNAILIKDTILNLQLVLYTIDALKHVLIAQQNTTSNQIKSSMVLEGFLLITYEDIQTSSSDTREKSAARIRITQMGSLNQ